MRNLYSIFETVLFLELEKEADVTCVHKIAIILHVSGKKPKVGTYFAILNLVCTRLTCITIADKTLVVLLKYIEQYIEFIHVRLENFLMSL